MSCSIHRKSPSNVCMFDLRKMDGIEVYPAGNEQFTPPHAIWKISEFPMSWHMFIVPTTGLKMHHQFRCGIRFP